MSSLPLQVHEVLEQEYVSMYGPLGAKRPDANYDAAQIVDLEWAQNVLGACGVKFEGDEAALAELLNGFVAVAGAEKIQELAVSPAIGDEGKLLLARYAEHAEAARAAVDAAGGDDAVRDFHRRLVDDAFTGAVQPLRDRRLSYVYSLLHDRARRNADDARTALCISGGGIRSATFALGVIQGLASARILDKFDYLSTVSGGGYIGSWLSSWARRHPQGITGVQRDLYRTDTASGGRTEVPDSKIEPEPRPVKHLRDYSNYLSPRLGLTSADTWTMVSLYLRNLLLNLLVIVPVLAAALAIPRAFAYLLEQPVEHDTLIASTLVLLAIGFGYLGASRPISGKSRLKNTDARFIVACLLPFASAAMGLSLFWADVAGNMKVLNTTKIKIAVGIAIGLMTVWPSLIYYCRVLLSNTARRVKDGKRSFRESLGRRIWFELIGTIASVGTSLLLFTLVGKELFPEPLADVPQTATLTPVYRAITSAMPWASVYLCLAIPIALGIFYLQASIFVGISGKVNDDYDREWWGRGGAWLLIAAFGIFGFSAITVFGPVALYHAPVILGSLGGGSGILAALLGFGSTTPANKKQKDDSGTAAKVSNAGLALAVPLFVVFFLAAIALATTWFIQQAQNWEVTTAQKFESQFTVKSSYTQPEKALNGASMNNTHEAAPAAKLSIPEIRSTAHYQVVQNTGMRELLGILAAFGIALILSRCIGVNKFSMHALYRNRLIRAYLGASRYFRSPDAFTGFDERDDFKVHELRPELLWGSAITDAPAFVAKIKGVPEIWSKLHEPVKEAIDEAGNQKTFKPSTIHLLVAHINGLLSDPLFDLGAHVPDWAKGHAAATRNRAAIDALAAGSITPMAPPDDAPPVDVDGQEIRRAPMHIVNMCLNLVSGEKLAWQQRKAESFTVSPLHSGSLFVGYRDTKEYGGEAGISLGTAVTISGAAASPNMGYHSSPAMAFLLAVFNVRLGWWLGNPGPVGEDSYREEHPKTNLGPMFAEVTGKTNDRYPWIYLSDGGHFENLGLYEMVLRRCHYIVLSDAGADPKFIFDDLGNAIRKIRTDLGVPIDIDHIDMSARVPSGEFNKGRYVATATIRYSAVDENAVDGKLIYVKPGLYANDFFPRDVYNYACESGDFPHESTADQFFSESQFESYRALGRHVVNEICEFYPKKKVWPWVPVATPFQSVGDFAESVFRKSQPPEAQLDEVIHDGVSKVAAAVTHAATNIWANAKKPVPPATR